MIVKMYNCVRVDTKIYFVCYDMNMICFWDSVDENMHILGAVPEEPLFKEGLFGNIVYESNVLILVPFNASKIWTYDLKNNVWKGFSLPENKCNKHRFYGCIAHENHLYFLGYNYPGILKMDLNSGDIKEIEINKKIFENDYVLNGFLNWNSVIKDGYLITPTLCSNKVLKINLSTEKVEYLTVGDAKQKHVGLVWDDEKFWIAPREGNVYLLWDGKKKIEETRLPDELNCSGQYFGGIYMVFEHVIFTSYKGDSVCFNKRNTHDMQIIKKSFLFGKCLSDSEIILGGIDGNITWITGEQIKNISCNIDDKEYYEFITLEKNQVHLTDPVQEYKMLSLRDFINLYMTTDMGGNNE